uniref:Uncharacterized protein n=1 Tax=Populus trichocarpa TaxID=3694 RepID=U7DYD5_POPTR
MTMIPSGGAAVFSSPPLCRARGLCFFFPLYSALFLFSLSGSAAVLSVVAGRNGGGAGGGAVTNDGEDGGSLLLVALLPTTKR